MSITEDELKTLQAGYTSKPFEIGDTRYFSTTFRTTRTGPRTYRDEHFRTCALCDASAWLPSQKRVDDATLGWLNDHDEPYLNACFCPNHHDEGLTIRQDLRATLQKTAQEITEKAIAHLQRQDRPRPARDRTKRNQTR